MITMIKGCDKRHWCAKSQTPGCSSKVANPNHIFVSAWWYHTSEIEIWWIENGSFVGYPEHSIRFHDILSTTIRQIFPNSQIAVKYHGDPTKDTCILNSVFTPFLIEDITSAMKDQLFSIWIDGSNDKELEKMNAITVEIYKVRSGKIVNLFLEMCEVIRPQI